MKLLKNWQRKVLADFWNRIKVFVFDAVGVIVAVLAGFAYYEKSKKDAAEAQVQNEADQKKIDSLAQDQANNDGQNDAEAAKRAELEKQLQGEQSEQLDKDAILRIINTPDNK